MKNMAVVTKGLDKAMASMNLEEVEKIMQKFESQFEDLDVREQVNFKVDFRSCCEVIVAVTNFTIAKTFVA